MSHHDGASWPRVQVDGVHLAFAGDGAPRRVLTGVDLEVIEREVVAIAGRSGSGKTTLLTVIAGLEAPDAGTVAVLGRPADHPHPWHQVALLPQSLGLLDELTVEENVALPSRLQGSGSAVELRTCSIASGSFASSAGFPVRSPSGSSSGQRWLAR